MPPLCHGGKTQQDPVPELEAMLRPPLPWSFGAMLPEVGFYLQKKLTQYFWLQVKEKKKSFAFQACHIVQKIYDAIANESQTL